MRVPEQRLSERPPVGTRSEFPSGSARSTSTPSPSPRSVLPLDQGWSPLDDGATWSFEDSPNTPNVVDIPTFDESATANERPALDESAPVVNRTATHEESAPVDNLTATHEETPVVEPSREAPSRASTGPSEASLLPPGLGLPTLPLAREAADPATDFAETDVESSRRSAHPESAPDLAPPPRATTPSVTPYVPAEDEASKSNLLDEDAFNPFSMRSSGNEAEDRVQRGAPSERPSNPWAPSSVIDALESSTFGSFLDASQDSVPSGLQAMLGGVQPDSADGIAPGGSRPITRDDDANDWSPSSTRSIRPFDDDDMREPSASPSDAAADSGDGRPRAETPRGRILDEAPMSVFELPAAPSLSALDAALGNVLGSRLDSALEQGAGNMASQLDALLNEDRRSVAPGPEVDFGRLSEEFNLSDLEGANLASKIPPPADTMRGAVPGETFPPPGMRSARARRSDAPWEGVPGQLNLDRLREDHDNAVEDIDEPVERLWDGAESDDFEEPKVRRGSSTGPSSSQPPPWAPAPDEDESAPTSEWGTVPPPPNKKAIPNYEEQLSRLGRPSMPSTAPVAKRESIRPTSSPPPEPRPPRPRAPLRGTWVAAAFVLLAVCLTLLPWYLLTRAEKRANACFQDILRTTEGDPDTCRPNTSDLALARNLPWLEEDARRVKEWSDFRAARLAYDKATAITPNATRRDETAQRLLDLTYRGTTSERTAALGVVAGAHAAVTSFALANREPEAVSFALRSARALGSIDDMRALATGSGADDPFGMSLRRGALLCLLGDANEGARAFVQADIAHQRLNTTMEGHNLARLGLVACGRAKGVSGEIDAHSVNERVRPAMAALEASLETQEGYAAARSFLEGGKHKVGGVPRVRIAPWVIRETKPSALEALRMLAPQHAPAARVDLNSLRTPWTMYDVEAPFQAVYMDPQAAEAAAAYLLKTADSLAGKPLDCSGEECPDAAAVKMPQAVLSEAARMFWLEAAAEHARLGRREATLEAVAKVSEMSGRQRRHLVAPIHLAVGDADGALKSLGYALEHLETYSGAGQLRIHLNHALALAHLGRYEPAMGAAEKAYYAAAKAEEELQGKTDALDEEVALQDDRISAAWLWGAMSLLAGKPDRLSEALRDVRSQELSDVVTWTRLAAQPEETRRAGRWDLSLATLSESALPAVMYVVSRAVPSMMDVEVWLDRIFQQEHRTQPTRAMLARAEVARWRNDPEAERNWQGRSAKLLGLVKDYRTSLLAHILELR